MSVNDLDLIPSQPRRWTDAYKAGEVCAKALEAGSETVETLAAKCGVAPMTVKRWLFMYHTGAYKPTSPREYGKALGRLLERIGMAETCKRLHVSESWVNHILSGGKYVRTAERHEALKARRGKAEAEPSPLRQVPPVGGDGDSHD